MANIVLFLIPGDHLKKFDPKIDAEKHISMDKWDGITSIMMIFRASPPVPGMQRMTRPHQHLNDRRWASGLAAEVPRIDGFGFRMAWNWEISPRKVWQHIAKICRCNMGCNMMLGAVTAPWVFDFQLFSQKTERPDEGLYIWCPLCQRNIQTHANLLVEPPLFCLPWCIPTYIPTYLPVYIHT